MKNAFCAIKRVNVKGLGFVATLLFSQRKCVRPLKTIPFIARRIILIFSLRTTTSFNDLAARSGHKSIGNHKKRLAYSGATK